MSVPYLSEDGKRVYCCGVPVIIDVAPSSSSKILVKYEGGEFEANKNCAVYGGFDSINNEVGEVPYTSITMNGGEVYSLNGSNWGPSNIEKIKIIFNGGKAQFVSAGIGEGANDVVEVWSTWHPIPDAECYIKYSDITINGGEVTNSVFGGLGSGWGFVENVSLTIAGGKVRYATGTNGVFPKGTTLGGSKDVVVNVNGGEIEYLYGCSESSNGNVTMNVNDGEIGLCSMYGYSLMSDTPKNTKIDANLMGGTIDKLCVYAAAQISSEHAGMMENVDISYYPGVINEADIANSPKEIKEDPYKGQGADMKTIRFYPFPHKSDRVFGILTEGKPLDRPCELLMSEQEIRMCLGMGHVFEVVDGKLVLLDAHNYNQDNSEADEFAGELPCDDCELVYPRKAEEKEKPVVKAKAHKQSTKQEEFTEIPTVGAVGGEKKEEVKPEEPKKAEAKVEAKAEEKVKEK